MPPAMKRKVHTKTPIADDLEVHTSTVHSGSETFFEIRQFIPSLKQYGRGVALPADPPLISNNVVVGLIEARRELQNDRMDAHTATRRTARKKS